MKVLVSACLLGENCKYNGGNNYNETVVKFLSDKDVISVCPEVLGGMPVPRPCSEIVNGVVTDCNGDNVDREYRKGVGCVLEMLKDQKIDLAILQPRSPTCGVNRIYDGTFSGKLISGSGVFAKALIDIGCNVIDSEELPEYIRKKSNGENQN